MKSSCCYAHRVTVQVAQRGPSLRRVDPGLDKAKICSDRRIDADGPRLGAVFGGGKAFLHSLGHFRRIQRFFNRIKQSSGGDAL